MAPAVLAFLIATGYASAADEAAVRRCRAIPDSLARLACYDALPLGATPSAPLNAAPPQSPFRPQPGQPKAPPAPAPAENFGLEHKARSTDELATIETYIPGRFEGWRPGVRITLANGQVWQVIDETSRYMVLDNPKVVVRRGLMGAFFLDVEGDNRSPRVRRVQ
ncbi:MAG: hypothetical protein ABIR98_15430 [Usitatibacter sp.]